MPPALGARAVRGVLDDVRPDTVVTFGPDGFTGHDDHRAVSGWVDAALAGHGRPVRLLQPTVMAVSVTTGAGVRALEGRAVCYTIALPDARAR